MKVQSKVHAAELRRLAEARLEAEPELMADEAVGLSRLVHELQVHQIELEVQNESLVRAQDELEATHRRYQSLFELAPFGYLVLDARGVIIEANAAAARLVGVERPRLVGLTFGRFVEPGSSDRWRAFFDGLLAAVDPEGVDLMVRAPRGVFTARVSGVVLRDDGEVRCYCALHDVSRERLAEALLQQQKESAEDASRAKSEFLARVSHELRTPLSSIQMAVELALEETLPARARRYLQLALRASEGLLGVIAETLDLAKIEARRIELADEPFELASAIETSLASLWASAEAKGLEFAIDVDPALATWYRGDRGRLGQVLINLVANAVKFTERGHVGIRVRVADEAAADPDRQRLLFVVSDSGIGLATEAAEALFEPFNRVASGGVGLGLTIARELVGLMGGRIWAEGRPGVGATFSFVVELGVVAEPPRTEDAGADEVVVARPRTILLAEDDPICRETEAALLERAGHRVRAVDDGREALEALTAGDVEVLVLDVHMPGLGGDEVTELIRAGGVPGAPRDLIIIGLTAVLLAGDSERHVARGMDVCLAKPLEIAKVQRVLAGIDEAQAARGRSRSA